MRNVVQKLMIIVTLIFVPLTTANADEWKFPVAVTFVNGAIEFNDQLKDNMEADYWDVESSEPMIPIATFFQPYYEYDSGFGLGAGIGPILMAIGDIWTYDIPLMFAARYTFSPNAKISPYVRGGISYHLAGGDYIEDSSFGLAGAVGIEFMRDRAVNLGVEVGYDSATVTMEDKTSYDDDETVDITPVGLTLSIFAIF